MKKLLMAAMLMLLAVFAVACGTDEKTKADEETTAKELTIKHELGETKVKQNPEKVVVFDFGTLDTLQALGLSNNVAGLPKQSLPKYLNDFAADKYANLGGLKEPDFEKINEAAPDLNIISGRQSDSYDKFSDIAPTIYQGVDAKDYMKSFQTNVNTIASIFGKEDEAKKQLDAIDKQVADVKASVPEGKTGLILLANDGKMSAYGPGSRFGLIHDVLGVTPADPNIEASTHGQSVSSEYIAEKNPDYIYVVDRGAAVGGESSAKSVVENELVKKTNAYKNDHIVYLNPEYWYLSGGGLESVAEMVKEVGDSLK
ncbi:siderophore ABC transporter substrate-binding protein [Listeria booriae]|uniref:Siderophore ABC transporter substrate-binding protein n=1 Tax=Listeria booriae TaxID=1552123 RepID=A0A7X0XWA0_9LIST|nr:siderophore ABC transporter substrate-binding protein [Listeria booriae]MBC1559999.1 siderophore ABC transporter substrate-binding protein [Listeria booriae]MBC1792934.1 siderophore ABC transporter substrate-binding protein [Listeria booriae]MBC1800725.1 siderophore ABC transporter substrate-binding protein [Listeria booriae]MBC2193975.1 siderophore ABC transporter substrate-binding protein [Listeria booriae]